MAFCCRSETLNKFVVWLCSRNMSVWHDSVHAFPFLAPITPLELIRESCFEDNTMRAAHVCANRRLGEQSLAETSGEGSSVKSSYRRMQEISLFSVGKFTHMSSSIIEVIWNVKKTKQCCINSLPNWMMCTVTYVLSVFIIDLPCLIMSHC